MALLDVQDLHIRLRTHRGTASAVREVGFVLERGDTLGLIGESGCGKSITALALMGLQADNVQVSGSIRLEGQQLVGLRDRQWRQLRGNRMAMIFQEPMTALNPVHRVGAQIAEPLRLHRGLGARAARQRAIELMERVGIPEPAQRADAYPHQFSGGQRQRLMIAMALACEPDVLIADEPTTALDATIQKQILELIRELVRERGMALILISHDLALVAENVQRMLVMYGGRVVEAGLASEVFGQPAPPDTRGLLAARPGLHVAAQPAGQAARLPTIAGTVPDLFDLPPGCPFAGRCPLSAPACSQAPVPRRQLSPSHHFDCHRSELALQQKDRPA